MHTFLVHVFSAVFVILGAGCAIADCGVSEPTTPKHLSRDLAEISDAATKLCAAYPVEVFDAMTLPQIQSKIDEINGFLEFDLPEFKGTIEKVCRSLEDEDARINVAATKNRGKAPTEQQSTRKASILEALNYCAYVGANYKSYGDVSFHRNPVFWTYHSRLSKKAIKQLERYYNRYSECLAMAVCTTA